LLTVGSDWKGSKSLSLALASLRFRRKNAAVINAAIANVAAPTLATTIPAIWGVLSFVSDVGDVGGFCEEPAAAPVVVAAADVDVDVGAAEVEVRTGDNVVPDVLLLVVVVSDVVGVNDVDDLVIDCEFVAVAAWTILGEAVSSTRVADKVACVFARALGFPRHILYAPLETSLFPLCTSQNPILLSAIIHCNATSPTVYPDLLLLLHKHSNEGVVPHVVVG
jgi:hypothetical protein